MEGKEGPSGDRRPQGLGRPAFPIKEKRGDTQPPRRHPKAPLSPLVIHQAVTLSVSICTLTQSISCLSPSTETSNKLGFSLSLSPSSPNHVAGTQFTLHSTALRKKKTKHMFQIQTTSAALFLSAPISAGAQFTLHTLHVPSQPTHNQGAPGRLLLLLLPLLRRRRARLHQLKHFGVRSVDRAPVLLPRKHLVQHVPHVGGGRATAIPPALPLPLLVQ